VGRLLLHAALLLGAATVGFVLPKGPYVLPVSDADLRSGHGERFAACLDVFYVAPCGTEPFQTHIERASRNPEPVRHTGRQFLCAIGNHAQTVCAKWEKGAGVT